MTERTDEPLWRRIVSRVKGEPVVGTKAGQWSARKAQLAVREYKQAGGGYKGRKDPNNSLIKWGKQEWTTKSGKPSHITGERYLPKKAIQALTSEQYARTTQAKRKSTKQFSKQPADVAEITKRFR